MCQNFLLFRMIANIACKISHGANAAASRCILCYKMQNTALFSWDVIVVNRGMFVISIVRFPSNRTSSLVVEML